MELNDFNQTKCPTVAICFLQEEYLNTYRASLEAIGELPHVQLVVQPCPYEGIEFLFQIDETDLGDSSFMDEKALWKVLRLKDGVDEKALSHIKNAYLEYWCAILAQDNKQVTSQRVVLNSYAKWLDAAEE